MPQVTVTRTTTSTTVPAKGYFKTTPGLLKILQLILGIIDVGIIGYYYRDVAVWEPAIFYFLISTTFMIGTALIVLSLLVSQPSTVIMSKTIFELIYHGFAFILYFSAGMTLTVEINRLKYAIHYDPLMAAGILGIVCSFLYLATAVLSRRNYIDI